MKAYLKLLIIVTIVLSSGCGGGGSDDIVSPTIITAQGQFIDSPVRGLSYTSGENFGSTDLAGIFSYEVIDGIPQPVRFAVGNLVFGSAKGGAFITPLNLSESTQVQENMVRLLISLDGDQDSSNGIDLTSLAVNTNAFDGSRIDFDSINFATSAELIAFFNDISTIQSRSVTLVDKTTADVHINATYRCLLSGNYYGVYNGDDSGPIVLAVDPSSGLIGGIGWSRNLNIPIGFPLGNDPLQVSNKFSFSLSSDYGFVFKGNVQDFNDIGGSWSSAAGSGNYLLTRVANNGPASIVYRFTGVYQADIPNLGVNPIGAFSINVMRDNSLEGELVNIIDGKTNVTPMTGSVTNGVIAMTATNGITLSGLIDLSELSMTGVWSNPSGLLTDGTFSMNGCVLAH